MAAAISEQSLERHWFFKESVLVAYYDGNFSLLQAGELIYSREISFDLKRDVARRMLKYPKEVEKSFLLAFALKQLASGSPTNRLLYYVTVPLGRLEDGHSANAGPFRNAFLYLEGLGTVASPRTAFTSGD